MSKNGDAETLREQIRKLEEKCREQDSLIQFLRKSDQRFRDITELLPHNIYESTLDGTVIYANSNILRCFGFTLDDLARGLNIFRAIVPEDHDRMRRTIRERVYSGPGKGSEYTARRKDGSTFPVFASVVPIFESGKAVGIRGTIVDLSERKQAELALRQSEVRHRMALDSMADAIHVIDRDMRMVFMNSGCRELCRKNGLTGELEGLTPFEIFPFLPPEARDQYSRVFETGSPLLTEDTAVVDGTGIVMETRKVPIFEDGKVARVMTVFREVTDAKKAEEQLKKSEQEKAIILDTMSELVFYLDQDLKMIWANSAAYRQFKVPRGSMGGNYCYAFLHGLDRPCSICPALKAIKSGEFCRTEVISSYGKSWILRGYPVRDDKGNITGAVEIVTDVTESKQMEEALRSSEEKYQVIVEKTLDLIFAVDRTGHFSYVNPRFERITGYSSMELIGRPFTLAISPEDALVARDRFRQGMRGMEIPPYRTDLIHKNGGRIPVEFLVTTMYDASGNPSARFGIGRDLTERLSAEARRVDLEAQLFQAQKMEAIGTLAGGIAHDFNNLLMGIQGYTSLMLYEMDSSHPFQEKLRNIERQVRSGAELTRQLLGFARVGKYEIRPTDLNELIGRTAEMFGRTKKEIAIHKRLQERIWPVEADGTQLEQAMLNLYLNSWQAMPGGGDLFLETLNVFLDEKFTRPHSLKPGKYVKISVSDTGVGMDEKVRKRIFEPFFTTKTMGRGTGLGLASAYGIIKGHGGIIQVSSSKGAGTTFDIYLPAGKKPSEKLISAPAEQVKKGKETILVIDDEDYVLDVSREYLELLGYKVLVARSGHEAMDIYRREKDRIDVVLLDMVMPRVGGEEVFEMLKSCNKDVPVILSSGYSLSGQAAGIMKKGCRSFIQKPFTMETLSERVRAVLDSPRESDRAARPAGA
ncbi:MAG: PAS domain S-box protein [Syntrophales bacterium]|nr:PAS domain S-box protein [Syntrophales bacterium]MDD5531724.1 PAS domain S-box protein [Syntrophales bacterium]